MQLQPPSPPSTRPPDVAAALQTAAERLGHRPAVSVLLASGRQEQSVASLAQWAAKGAHLLELDLLLEPGDHLHLDAPPSWPAVTVALAAWWAGVTITLDGDAEVAVIQAGRDAPPDAEVFRLGDGVDGAPDGDTGDEFWVRAVQAFPDQPPTPRASGDTVALVADGATWTQAQLLTPDGATGDGVDPAAGPVGIDTPVDARLDRPTLIDLALRPLLTGRPTVVVRGVGRDAAAGDRVTVWR